MKFMHISGFMFLGVIEIECMDCQKSILIFSLFKLSIENLMTWNNNRWKFYSQPYHYFLLLHKFRRGNSFKLKLLICPFYCKHFVNFSGYKNGSIYMGVACRFARTSGCFYAKF